jgi:hypothetical protein
MREPMRTFRATTALLFVCLACAHASAQGKVRARAKGRSVVFTERGRAHTVNFWEKIDAARIEDASVLFLTRKGGFVYLVLSVCGPSKVPSDDHECGAGVECNLVWLKLDERWRIQDSKSERYESCWAPITSDGGPKAAGRRLTLEYDNLRDNLHHVVTYDSDAPEQGLQSATEPLKEP